MLSRKRFSEIVGENVKRIRLSKGLSQEELAHICKFYRTYINLVESAKRTPSSYNLYRLAKGLKVKINDLSPSTV